MKLRRDAFLDGKLQIDQPETGYRAGADPVFLGAAVPAKPGQDVLELGCGAGVAMLCLMARVPELSVTGVERVPAYAELARQNLALNDATARVVTADLTDLPPELRQESFDHVLANPPFFDRARGSRSPDMAREVGRGMETSLSAWVESGIRRLRPGGVLSVIQRIEALPSVLACFDGRMGGIHVLPLAPREGVAAKLFVLNAEKGVKSPFRLLSPLTLHKGETHQKDGDSYTPEARAILRSGAPLSLRD